MIEKIIIIKCPTVQYDLGVTPLKKHYLPWKKEYVKDLLLSEDYVREFLWSQTAFVSQQTNKLLNIPHFCKNRPKESIDPLVTSRAPEKFIELFFALT